MQKNINQIITLSSELDLLELFICFLLYSSLFDIPLMIKGNFSSDRPKSRKKETYSKSNIPVNQNST